MTRRTFVKMGLLSVGAFFLSSLGVYKFLLGPGRRFFPGKMVGASAKVGHLLRGAPLATPTTTQDVETIIVGGGIAGLSAAWWLKKHGYQNFKLLDLEPEVGGNSSSGKNDISAYPWGAHYLPLPGAEARYVHELLEELGVIEGHDLAGQPIYNEFYLCADPHERLFLQGRWQEGMVPQVGASLEDRRQYSEFFSAMEKYKNSRGTDGKRAFVIPVDLSSQDSEFRSLDQMTMADFMRERAWDSKYLNWYVNYCCRDDFGAEYDQVSAWAGIHYFASRNGRGANVDSQTVLTWPEGNGWLVNQLKAKCAPEIQSNALAFSVKNVANGVEVDYLDTHSQQTRRLRGKKVIFASPRFVGSYVVGDMQKSRPAYLRDLNYAPWMVANVSVSNKPRGNGVPLSWDNVSYYSKSLGCVVATHQDLTLLRKKTVLTYYQPLSDQDPVTSRKLALEKTHQQWAQAVAADLEKMHPGIEDEIDNIDVCVWGHGMVIPRVGYISGESRRAMRQPLGSIHFAHSDMSGISIFEEAQYHGVQAARQVLKELQHASG